MGLDWFFSGISELLDDFLTGTCKIEARQKGAVDQYGAPRQDAWVTVVNRAAYRFIKPTKRITDAMIALGMQEVMSETYLIICPTEIPFAVDQRVTTEDGRMWLVVSIDASLTEQYDAHAIVTRVKTNV